LTPKVLGRAIAGAVERAPSLEEWIEPRFLARQKWPSWQVAVHLVHAPESEADLSPMTAARQRLAYDELLANQLALALVRQHQRRKRGRPIAGDGSLRAKATAALPFELTPSQIRSVEE